MQSLLDKSTNGVILFSLGTNVRSKDLGKERLTHILEAFRKLSQYTIICKFDLEEISLSVPKNVHIRKWLPQNEVLGKF